MLFLSICAISISGYAIAAWNAASYGYVMIIFALILWAFECLAQLCSVMSENPLLGMLVFMCFWFIAFLFSGVMVAEESVIWPFRVFTSVFPLKWGLRSFAYLEYSGTTYAGAKLCETAADPTCFYHAETLPGWACDWSPSVRPCLGHTGEQVLDSMGITFSTMSSEDSVLFDALIILCLGAAFKLLYIGLFVYKSRKSTKLRKPESKIQKLASFGSDATDSSKTGVILGNSTASNTGRSNGGDDTGHSPGASILISCV